MKNIFALLLTSAAIAFNAQASVPNCFESTGIFRINYKHDVTDRELLLSNLSLKNEGGFELLGGARIGSSAFVIANGNKIKRNQRSALSLIERLVSSGVVRDIECFNYPQ